MDESNKSEMTDRLYKTYGHKFPLKAKYKRDKNRIYFSDDFADSEEIEFFCNCEKPSSNAIGNAWYIDKSGISKLINIKDLE